MTNDDSSPSSDLKVGVIGLGQMGGGVARNLRAQGLLRAVWDVSQTALDAFESDTTVLVAQSARQLGDACDIVVFVVPSTKEIAACLDAHDGILASTSDSQIFLDLTTSDPAATKTVIEQAKAYGRAYLDAGMSGGALSADSGSLALMVGGDAETFHACKPVFQAIADMDKVFHVGLEGAGHTMKLVHNMICHTIFMATAEGCRVAERAGIDLATAIRVINDGNARSFVSEQRFPNHILSGKWDARSRISNLEKDLQMGVSMARDLGAPAAFSAETVALLERAMKAGMADDDFSLLYKEFDRLAE